ncbi:MFS transporter [Streptomyces sp. MN03-5084-2B]|nr:MFS transporter [Streptomyces sp. MN03-5084-2B]
MRLPRGEFAAIWGGELGSVVGDQLAKVAVALLVFDRTGSAAWTGAAYAANFLAPLVAGPLLAGLADRYRRRELMMTCLLLQAMCVALMAVPAAPILLLVAGTMVVASLQVPFKGAQGAVVRQVLAVHMIEKHAVSPDDPARDALNGPGRARLVLIREIGQLAGLGGAAAVVLAIGTSWALIADVVTFVFAALLLRFRLRDRAVPTAAVSGGSAVAGLFTQLQAAGRLVRDDRAVRLLVAFIALIGCTAAADAVIVPLTAELGAPRWAVGPLLAADCVGMIAGARWMERQPGDRKTWLMGPLAVLSVAPLVPFWLEPIASAAAMRDGGAWWWLALGAGMLLVVSGACSVYYIGATAELTERVNENVAGTVNGLSSTILRAVQGLGAITAGALAQISSAGMAVALVGSLGVLLTGACAVQWRRLQRSPHVRSTAGT